MNFLFPSENKSYIRELPLWKKGEKERKKRKQVIRTEPALLRGSCEKGKESTP